VPLRDESPRTPLELLLDAGAGLAPPPPACVTGRHHPQIAAAAPGGLEIVENPAWKAGRTGSVQRAVERFPGEDLCLAPVDVPIVPRGVLDALREAWERAGAPPRGWIAPRVTAGAETRFGHPVIVGRELLAELRGWPPDRSLRELRALADPLLAVESDSPSVLLDLDTADDLERIRARFSGPDLV